MRISTIAFAVASALAAASAGATDRDIYVTGASAQRNFWVADLKNICGGSSVPVITYDGKLTNSPAPDFKAYRCTAAGSPIAPVAVGDTVTMHFTAELGSVWGIAPALWYSGDTSRPGTDKRLFLEPGDGSGCTGSGTAFNCPGTAAAAYNYNTDTVVGGSTLFARHTPDIVVTDVEPSKWQFADNWPAYTIFGAAPDSDALSTATGLGESLTGQLFAVVLHGVPSNPTNLSRASIQSIFQGSVGTWSQIPEVGAADTAVGGTPIRVCRRDHGSGTQVAASITFTGSECGLTNAHTFVSSAEPNNITALVENPASSSLATCMGQAGANIGIASYGTNANYSIISIDGVEANAHNAAAGYYPFAYETWGANITGLDLATTFLNRVKQNSTLGTVLGTESVKLTGTGGRFFVDSGTVKAYFSLQAGNSPSVANLTNGATTAVAGVGIPVAAYDRGGESCKVSAFSF